MPGSTSLKVHIPQCERMWKARQQKKKEKDQKPVPAMPHGLVSLGLPTGAVLAAVLWLLELLWRLVSFCLV